MAPSCNGCLTWSKAALWLIWAVCAFIADGRAQERSVDAMPAPAADIEEELLLSPHPTEIYWRDDSGKQAFVSVAPPAGDLPNDESGRLFATSSSGSANIHQRAETKLFMWHAANSFHGPLYFDNVPLEIHGQTRSHQLQPLLSGVRFYSTTVVLPLKMLSQPPHQHVYSLGTNRPGSPAPLT